MARYIVTDKDKIVRTDMYLVKIECADGQVFDELEPRRLFPITDLNKYITLLNEKEKEIALIEDLTKLDKSSQKAINDCFEDFYLIPNITAVLDINDKFGVLKWTVMTDRGEISFSIRNRHSDIKLLGKKRLFIRDSNDNRYLGDIDTFDRSSLRKVFCYI